MQEFDTCDFFALGKLTSSIATLYLLQMLQMVSLRVVNVHLTVQQASHQATSIVIKLQRGDEMICFRITCHSSCVDHP